ncbi:MAG: RluA family pseudouridine synthase [Alphaproteobacteria bacterium]|nr:RluA family pseudouridine synthase [Alphaproteobacteria bacterium]
MLSIIVSDEHNSQRIDKFLCKKFDISFSLSQKIIREKKIKINNKKAQISDKLNIGDQISIFEKLNLRKQNLLSKPNISIEKQKKFWQNIIFEDENIIAIDKPSGLATQGGSLIDISVDDYVKLKKYHLVHRLDKDTSGVLLIAKNNHSSELLVEAFKNKTIRKTYIALVLGHVKKNFGTIDIPLAKQMLGKNEKVQADFEFGKKAITNYRVIKNFNDFTQLELNPITGRTHQLRVHCKEIGHPILNDIKYGGKKVDFKNIFPRLCLHSFKIEIPNYRQQTLVIETRPPNFTLK